MASKHVATLALRTATKTGAFLIIHEHELAALDALPLWMTRLFTALLRQADHATGRGQVTYAALLARLQPLQPRSGPRHYVPDMQALKRAIDTLESRRLIARDALHSQALQALVFQVVPRYEKARPKRKLDPQTRPPVDSAESSTGAASSPIADGTRPPNLTPSSAINSLHSKEGDLSTGPARLKAVRAELAARGAGDKRAPKGA